MDILGKKIKARRKEMGMTQEMMALRLNCDRSYISRIENGLIRPEQEFIRRMARILDLPIEELWSDFESITYDKQVIDRCSTLALQGRELEAQTLSAAIWWDILKTGDRISEDVLYKIIRIRTTSDPEILAPVFFRMLNEIHKGNPNDVIEPGLFLIRSLGESGNLVAAYMINKVLLLMKPTILYRIKLSLSQGTTSFRLNQPTNALSMYQQALAMINTSDKSHTIYEAQAMHGLSACYLTMNQFDAALEASQKACQYYETAKHEELYFLALQNLGIALRRLANYNQGDEVLSRCAAFWKSKRADRYRSVLEELLSDPKGA